MQTYLYKDKTVQFRSLTGEILDSTKYSETHISSSGGGGYVGKNGGVVTAPRVHSTSVTMQDFWIRNSAGKEVSIQLAGCDIPLRPGQRVSVLIADEMKSKRSTYVALINHTAETVTNIKSTDKVNVALEVEVISGKTIFKGIGLMIATTIVFNLSSFLGFIFLGLSGFLIWKKFNSIKSLLKNLKAEIEKSSHSLLEQAPINSAAAST